jgi:hypothetical protein
LNCESAKIQKKKKVALNKPLGGKRTKILGQPGLHSDSQKKKSLGIKPLESRVAHACNPSYSGGRNQEDQSWTPALASSSQDPILKKIHHKNRADGVAQGVGPEFKPQHHKKKKKISERNTK